MTTLSVALKRLPGIISNVIGTQGLKRTVTYQKYSETVFDEAEGANVDTYTDISIPITAVLQHTEDTKKLVGAESDVQSGDSVYVILQTHLGDLTDLSVRDRIVENGQAYPVKDVAKVQDIVVYVTVEGGPL